MKITIKLILLIVIAALAATIVLLVRQKSVEHEASLEKPKPSQSEPGIVRFAAGEPQLSSIRAEVVRSEPMPVADPVNGRFVYDENATSRVTSPLLGRVIALRAGVGDRVARGAALLEVDSPDLANAEADLAKASSDELRKKLAYERARRLHDHEVIARKELEAAEADYRQSQADTQRSSLRLRSLQSSGHQNGKFVLRAPLSGIVVERNANPGQEVRPDLEAPLFLISDISRLWVLVDVPERSLANVHAGQTVVIETDAYRDQQFTATVERIGVAVDPVTRRVQVRCTILNADGKLKPEMFARVAFLASSERKGIRVPNAALVTEGIYSFLFVEKS
ncbi:MAG: efflux RND transporter periplasmic adaptor subunit, partial [Oxalobacteraceae bacterium]|nr:efflux RND transporter periplasmic adaptor subunit [Oxalobacteraceae bacterium]